jgi:hypothetical protein
VKSDNVFFVSGTGVFNQSINFPVRFFLTDLIIQFVSTGVSVTSFTTITLNTQMGTSVDFLQGISGNYNQIKSYVGTAQVNMYFPLNVDSYGVRITHNASFTALYYFKFRWNGQYFAITKKKSSKKFKML